MNIKNYLKMSKYTKVWLKVGTKSCDRKILGSKKCEKKYVGTNKEILKNYREYLLI
jgi:hypothetical protein